MKFLLIYIFGAIGALSRFFLIEILQFGKFPFSLILINLLGTFLFAFFVKGYLVKKEAKEIWLLAIGTGFFGAFTSFSSVILDMVKLFNQSEILFLIFYFILQVFGGILMIFWGLKCARSYIK